MRRLLFHSSPWPLGFLILVAATVLLLTVGQVRAVQWEDEDSVIVKAATDEEEKALSSARQKRQFGAGFPFGPNGFPQFPGFPGGFPGGFPQLFPTSPPQQQYPTSQPQQHYPTASPQPKPTAVPVGQLGSCLTRNGEEGQCATLRQCYPVLYTTVEGEDDKDGDEYIRNRGLAAELRDASGPCNSNPFYSVFMFRADAEARQKLICCTTHKQPPNPNQTMRPPWARPPTTEMTTSTTTQQPRKSTLSWIEMQTHPTHPPLPTHPPHHTNPTHPPPQQYPIQQLPPQQHPPQQYPQQPKPPQQFPIFPPQQFPSQQWPPPLPTHPPSHPVHQTQRPAPIIPTQSPPAHPSPPPASNPVVGSSCGTTRVVGGSQARKGEFPWLVALIKNQKQFCGGSLIDSQWIMTAAHCVQHMGSHDVSQIRVFIGDWDIYSNTDGPVTVKSVSTLVRHRSFSHQTLHNDIALLKLDSPVQFGSNGNNNIQPICLNTHGGYDTGSSTATVAGWGSLYENGPQPSIYHKVEMRIWTNNECKQKYGSYAPGGITSHMVCAGSPNTDACRGDSGGPLMKNNGGSWSQIGIVSWGIGCGRYPGVYSRVDQFYSWIQKNRSY